MLKKTIKAIFQKKNFPIISILLVALFIRVFRVGEILNFHYDQGRDAMVVWRLWKEGKLFLIGPITGLEGIFLGPFFYYLLAPFYLIGGGDPTYPAVAIGIFSTASVYFLYLLGKKIHSKPAGLIAAFIAAFSYEMLILGRWLSNPSPILLTSIILFWSLWEITQRKGKWWWVLASLMVGLSLQLEAASGIFYLPMMLIFVIWQRKNLPSMRFIAISISTFLLTLLPQILFNLRHDNILFDNFRKLFFEERAFKPLTEYILETRLHYFWSVAYNKIFITNPAVSKVVFGLLTVFTFLNRKKIKSDFLKLSAIFLLTPVVGYLFFQGNHGNIYNYYTAGYFLPFILLFGVVLGEVWKQKGGRGAIFAILLLFIIPNSIFVKDYLANPTNRSQDIYLTNQLDSVDWVFNNAKEMELGEFNVDVYVPPVIPHSYDYLFTWQGTKRCGSELCGLVKDRQVETLYTLYEVDPPYPERLEAWLARQRGIGEVVEENRFGGITVQRRERFK